MCSYDLFKDEYKVLPENSITIYNKIVGEVITMDSDAKFYTGFRVGMEFNDEHDGVGKEYDEDSDSYVERKYGIIDCTGICKDLSNAISLPKFLQRKEVTSNTFAMA